MKACYFWLWVILLGFFSLPSAAAGAIYKPLIAGGSAYTLAIKGDGSLWAWGASMSGALGLGDTTLRRSPTQVGTGWLVMTTGWVAVASGGNTSLGLRADGFLWAWGGNNYGQLGLGGPVDFEPHPTPVQVPGTGWVAVAAGEGYCLGLKADVSLWAWGWNRYGQLGLGDSGDFTTRTSPTLVGTGWVAVAAGGDHSLGLKADGSLWAWGHNFFGQLGLGDTTDRHSPTQVQVGTRWVAVAAGRDHSLGLKADGSLWAWGCNFVGQLGKNDQTHRHSPTQVQLGTRWVAVVAGSEHSLGLKADGSLWTWGRNDYGQLGLGDQILRTGPTQVGTGWVAVAAGMDHSLGLKADGSLWAWGANYSSQLGMIGTHLSPAPVPGFNSRGAVVIPLN